MPDPRDEMLRAMAAHRGLRLIKSRRRKPGGDFGRYGLADAKSGQDCFGIGKHGLEADADEIEDYLRRGAKADWKRSLGTAGKATARAKPKKRAVARAPDPPPKPASQPKPEPELIVREAKAGDAAAIATLLGLPVAQVKKVLGRLVEAGEAPFVAEQSSVVGCAAWHSIPTLQHGSVGRITLVHVAGDARRRGVGTRLIEAAEARLAERGCALFEAVSDIDLADAHGFFRRRGYERTSYRFAKSAGDA
jgi:ribosomal protein S18 acetylase RimI-like enzyme